MTSTASTMTTPAGTTGATAEELRQVAELIEAGQPREARRRTERILAASDAATHELLIEIFAALECGPVVRTARLRDVWRRQGYDGRALVEACVPRAERRAEAAKQAEREAQATRAERREFARRRPSAVTSRQGVPQPRRPQRATDNDTATRRYFDERVDPAEVTDEQSDYDQLDYDRAAVPPMRGLPCVACGVERATRDRQRAHDDGLCEDCRDSGTAGVPILPASASRDDVLVARCDYIAATSATTAERDARLNRDWRCMRKWDRFIVADWHARQPA